MTKIPNLKHVCDHEQITTQSVSVIEYWNLKFIVIWCLGFGIFQFGG
jgi:hypothetical protein